MHVHILDFMLPPFGLFLKPEARLKACAFASRADARDISLTHIGGISPLPFRSHISRHTLVREWCGRISFWQDSGTRQAELAVFGREYRVLPEIVDVFGRQCPMECPFC